MHKLYVIISCTIILLACAKKEKNSFNQGEIAEIPVKTTVCFIGVLEKSIFVPVTVEGWQKKVTCDVNSKITGIFVNSGDNVARGQLLFTFDSSLAEKQYHIFANEYNKEKAKISIEKELKINSTADSLNNILLKIEYDYLRQKEELAKYSVYSEVSGVISLVKIQKGMQITSGDVLATIYQNDKNAIFANILQGDIGKIKLGEKALVTIFGNKQIIGKIAEKQPFFDNFSCKVRIDSGENSLMAGMSGTAKIVTEAYKDVLLVPNEAIVIREGEEIVFVVKDGKALWTIVKTGEKNEKYCQIISGLNVGEEIVIEGQNILAHNASVNVMEK